MARPARRTPPTGTALVRLLAGLTDLDVPASNDAFAKRLSGWFDWTDAISLSAALDSAPAGTPERGAGAAAVASSLERELGRVRAALGKLVAARATAGDADDFADHRERCVACQQAMETNVGPLRRRARSALADVSPAMARLAALDAVMEQVVGARERVLLATLPARLEQHFERLRQDPADPPAGWREAFARDLRALLLAELDLRLQPVEGLLAALRTSSPGRHE
jgi:cytochrome c551/c552